MATSAIWSRLILFQMRSEDSQKGGLREIRAFADFERSNQLARLALGHFSGCGQSLMGGDVRQAVDPMAT